MSKQDKMRDGRLTHQHRLAPAARAAFKQQGVFTVDVEDYFQVSAFEHDIPRECWGEMESRVVRSTHRMLALLDEAGVRATFFVLGWVATHHPELIRDISRAGHEIGSHSYWHRLVYELTPDEFRCDLRRSRDVIQEIIGQRVQAFRAPSFSITKQSLWALEILAEEGFTVDSSIFPIHHDRYGIPAAERTMHTLETKSGPIREFPPAVMRFARLHLPASGGGYFRAYPFALTRYALGRAGKQTGEPFVFYTHPWELDPDQPRLAAGSMTSRIRHRINLASTERKLRRLLKSFRFSALGDVFGSPAAAEASASMACPSHPC